MSWFNRFERWLEPLAIPNITLYLIVGQVIILGSVTFGLLSPERLVLIPAYALGGEWWRVLTFVFIPPFPQSMVGAVFIAFGLYMLYMFGSTLENRWGVVRYNLFLATGYILTVGFAFITPGTPATNIFIAGSVFLAFAYLYPDFTLTLFFILPVKIKWLAIIAWIGYVWQFATGDLADKLAVGAATGNFLIFFARDIWLDVKLGKRRMEIQARRLAEEHGPAKPRHTCLVCGKTDLTHPELDFRYCSKCAGDQCYCPEHIRNHEHVAVDENSQK